MKSSAAVEAARTAARKLAAPGVGLIAHAVNHFGDVRQYRYRDQRGFLDLMTQLVKYLEQSEIEVFESADTARPSATDPLFAAFLRTAVTKPARKRTKKGS